MQGFAEYHQKKYVEAVSAHMSWERLASAMGSKGQETTPLLLGPVQRSGPGTQGVWHGR